MSRSLASSTGTDSHDASPRIGLVNPSCSWRPELFKACCWTLWGQFLENKAIVDCKMTKLRTTDAKKLWLFSRGIKRWTYVGGFLTNFDTGWVQHRATTHVDSSEPPSEAQRKKVGNRLGPKQYHRRSKVSQFGEVF